MKDVLVMMATYNGEKYLDEQLSSLFSQEQVNVKVLVRDDGSTDYTKEILERWHTKAELDWYTGDHLNVKYGFFDLLEHAAKMQFQYFAFCDQDDVWDSDKLNCAIQCLEKVNTDIEGLYYCGQRIVDEKLNLLNVHELSYKRNLYARFMINDAAGCTEVFNKALLNRVVRYKPDYLLMHDTWLVKVCLAVGGEVIVDPKPHLSYRQHSKNVVGLQRDLKSKLIRARQYINEQDIESQMRELYKGYADDLIPEYGEIVYDVLNYKKNLRSRFRLLYMGKFKYADVRISLIHILKVFGNKV